MNTKTIIEGFLKRADELGMPPDVAAQALQGGVDPSAGTPSPAPAEDPTAAVSGGEPQLSPEQLQELIQVLSAILAQEQGGADPTAGAPKTASEKMFCEQEDYIQGFLKQAFDLGLSVDQACGAYNDIKSFFDTDYPQLQKQAEHFGGFYEYCKTAGVTDDNQIIALYEEFLNTVNK